MAPMPRWRPVPVDPGTHAAVQNPSLSSWMSGFQIVRRNNSRHRRRRLSDRAPLPGDSPQKRARRAPDRCTKWSVPMRVTFEIPVHDGRQPSEVLRDEVLRPDVVSRVVVHDADLVPDLDRAPGVVRIHADVTLTGRRVW